LSAKSELRYGGVVGNTDISSMQRTCTESKLMTGLDPTHIVVGSVRRVDEQHARSEARSECEPASNSGRADVSCRVTIHVHTKLAEVEIRTLLQMVGGSIHGEAESLNDIGTDQIGIAKCVGLLEPLVAAHVGKQNVRIETHRIRIFN